MPKINYWIIILVSAFVVLSCSDDADNDGELENIGKGIAKTIERTMFIFIR